eukprot:3934581-Pleurochrysis_carterae.AAC.1
MSLSAGSASGCVSSGAAGRALASLSEAIKEAERARDSAATQELSTQPQAVNFEALDFEGWKRWAALSLFKG